MMPTPRPWAPSPEQATKGLDTPKGNAFDYAIRLGKLGQASTGPGRGKWSRPEQEECNCEVGNASRGED